MANAIDQWRRFCSGATRIVSLVLLIWGTTPAVSAQGRIGGVDRIEKPPTGTTEYGQREPVRSVEIIRRNGQTDIGYKGMPLDSGDEINVKSGSPDVHRVIVAFDDPRLKLLKLAPGSYVRLQDRETVQAGGNRLLGWITGQIQATTKYIQAIAPGTQYGIEVDGERTRVVVWEGEVRVSNLGPNPLTVSVGEKQLTEAFGPGPPAQARVPSFDEVKRMLIFGLDVDPVIKGTVTDENLQQQLHEDLIRAQFESRVQQSSVGPHVNLGNLFLFLGRYDDALGAYQEAEQVSTRPSAIYNGRGIALAFLNRFDDAGNAFSQAVSRDDESIIHNNMGNLRLLQGDTLHLDDAITEYHRASGKDPTNAAAYNGLSVAFMARSEVPAAIEAAKTSIRLRDRSVARGNLANAYLHQQDLTTALVQYERATELDPSDPGAWNNLGVCRLKMGLYEQAANAFSRAIELDSQGLSPENGFALALLGMNRTEEAIIRMIAVLKRENTNRTAYRNLGFLFLTEETARSLIEDRLTAEAREGPSGFRANAAQFLRFLQTLPSVDERDFDAAFSGFRIAAR